MDRRPGPTIGRLTGIYVLEGCNGGEDSASYSLFVPVAGGLRGQQFDGELHDSHNPETSREPDL